jgi:hypothetical protein
MWPTLIDLWLALSYTPPARRAPRRRPARHARSAQFRLELLENRCVPSINTATHVAGPNIDVSNLAGYQGETTIAINPTNPLNMIAGSNNGGAGSISGFTEAYWTKDGGNTWTPVNLGGNGDPGVAFDRAGNAYFSFIDNNFGISVRKSTDGGVTWAAPVQVAPPTSSIEDKPAITVGPDYTNTAKDRVYVGWDDGGGNDVLKVSSSGDGGATWTAPVSVDGQAEEIYAQPAVGPDGTFYIAWDNFATANQSSIMFSRSTDDGSTFSTPVLAATSTINLFIPNRYTIPAQPTRGIAADPAVAVEQSGPNAGRIYLSYTSAPVSHDATNIYLIASDNGGGAWTALAPSPVKVNDDTTSNSHFFAAMGIDPTNGMVNLAWYDARNDHKNQKVDVYFQSYSSAGVPSGANVKVTTATSDESNPKTNNPNQYGDYMGIAASGGFAFPVWTDHRMSSKSGSEEIFVDPPLTPSVSPPSQGGDFEGLADPTAPAAAPLAGAVPLLGASTAASAAPGADLPWLGSVGLNTAQPVGSSVGLVPQGPSLGVAGASTAASILAARAKPSSDGTAETALSQAAADLLDALFTPLDAALSLDG